MHSCAVTQMQQPSTDIISEFRLPLKWAAGLLAIAGWLLAVTVDPRLAPNEQLRLMAIAVLLLAMAIIAWQLDQRSAQTSRWLVIALATAMVVLVHRFWPAPGFLSLLAVPVALAAPLIGLPAMWVTAVAQSVLLAGGVLIKLASLDAALTALLAIWSIAGLMYAVIGPVERLGRWMWEYIQHVQQQLEDARDRKVQLEQALDDLMHANQQLARLNSLAQSLRQAAEDARIVKEQFVANVSHELRTPLNMITGFSEMMLQSPETYGGRISPALLSDLAVIHRNADHLSNLINDVLDLSQIEAEQMALSREYVNLNDIVAEAAMSVRPLYELKNLHLRTAVQADLPPLLCDRTRIQEVLLNLLSNAGRFTDQGGVELRAYVDGASVLVSIQDTGPGITPENLEKLFQPFHQLDGSLRRRHAGTGLGLSISKRFIELHGGKIWAESTPGQGTTFSFRLPLRAPGEELALDGAARWLNPEWEYVQRTRASAAPRAATVPRLVVLEESGNTLQHLLARHLDGIEIAAVSTLDEAQRELEETPAKALVLNGPSIADTLKRFDATTVLPDGVPALVCSVPGFRQIAGALDVFDLLVKPISRDMLADALDRLHLKQGVILIVDDEPDALQLFGRIITSLGSRYRVLLARDGREALDILGEQRADLILLDLVMPNMDGFQFLDRRRQDPYLQDIPVLVISARDPAGGPIVSSGLALVKKGGFSVQELIGQIRTTMEGRPSTSRPADPASPEAPPA